ncbi:hypothetical protein ACFL4L_00910 [bacterium]
MKRLFVFIIILFTSIMTLNAYPIDGFAQTGIRRLERLRLILSGDLQGSIPVEGALIGVEDIQLHLTGISSDSILFPITADPALQAEVDALFPNRDESYSMAIMDITPGKPFRYAARQENRPFSPGSVGKLVVIAGLFSELMHLYPDNIQKRKEVLISRLVVADQWIRYDDHKVPVYDPETRAYASRVLVEGDLFSLYEWIDHMLSASANAAASIVWKEALLMRAFGNQYPPTYEEEKQFFSSTPKAKLQEMAVSIVNDPLRQAGITKDEWQLGSFFTRRGKEMIPGIGSWGNPAGMLKYLVRLEQGQIVDVWSSLEIKRLMYMTAKRIRYASSPRLTSSAVYFKSGSLYKCKQEPDFECKKYMGNVENVMNSVAIVEHPDGRVYCVALMSNILKKNSAVEHQTLATYIDRILSQ